MSDQSGHYLSGITLWKVVTKRYQPASQGKSSTTSLLDYSALFTDNGKYLLGYALFTDLLTPYATSGVTISGEITNYLQ